MHIIYFEFGKSREYQETFFAQLGITTLCIKNVVELLTNIFLLSVSVDCLYYFLIILIKMFLDYLKLQEDKKLNQFDF